MADYIACYDPSLVRAFPGVDDLVRSLDRWALCSNKLQVSGRAELEQLGWRPEVALFAEDFAGSPKSLPPVLDALGLDGVGVALLGHTASAMARVVARRARSMVA